MLSRAFRHLFQFQWRISHLLGAARILLIFKTAAGKTNYYNVWIIDGTESIHSEKHDIKNKV